MNLYKTALLLCATITTTSVLATDYVTAVTALAPVGYYRLNEAIQVPSDIATNSGSAGAIGNGFYIGDTTLAPSHPGAGALVGSADTAAVFNPGYIQVPFDASIDPQGAFTAEEWVMPSGEATPLNCVMAYGHLETPTAYPNRSGWLLYEDDGTTVAGAGWNFRMYTHVGGNRALTLAGGDIPQAGTWYHVAVSYDGTNGFLYVNGAQVASGPAVGYVADTGGNFAIGTRNDLGFPFTGGNIDEVALYTNALSPATVAAHYANGINPSPSPSYDVLVQSSNPLLYYRLDEPAFTPPATLPTTANLGSWGASLDGSIQPGVAMDQAGVPYTGFTGGNLSPRFNGLIGGIQIANPPLNTDTCTFTAWIKRRGPIDDAQGPRGQAPGFAGILFQRGAVNATGLSFGAANNLAYNWENNASDYNFSSGLTIPDEVWSFIAGVFTPSNTILCLNGVFATNVIAHVAHDFSADILYIGLDDAGNRVTDGFIDEVAIFDKALTTSQLLALYAAGGMPPQITAEPVPPTGTFYEGQSTSFNVSATGVAPLIYQWEKGGTAIPGQTTTAISFASLKASDTANYSVVISNSFGSVTSSIVPLTVLASQPVLTTAPASAARYPGGSVTFSVASLGSTPIGYQWYKGGTAIPGATGTTYSIPQIQASDLGSYSVLATNAIGPSNSPPAVLSFLPVTPNFVSAVLARGPIVYYRLNETNGTTAADGESGFDGTFNPVSTGDGVAGPIPPSFKGLDASNTGFSFDGNTSDVSCAPMNTTMSTATIIAFIQPKGLPPTVADGPAGVVFCRGAGSDVGGLAILPTSGDLGYSWNNNANTQNYDSALQPTTGQWNFAALVIDTNQATMYLDSGSGLASAINPVANGPENFTTPIHLGTDPLINRIYNGELDEVAIYNRALSPAEIQAIHDAAYNNTYTSLPPQISVQPVPTTLFVGDNYTLTAEASGSQPLSYQWLKGGVPIPGAIRDSLNLINVATSDSGTYTWVATQGALSATSTMTLVTVEAPPSYVYLTNDLVLHLKFDGDFTDSSGRGNNAAVGGGSPAIIADGRIGKAAHLDNLDYLTVSDANSDLQFTETNSFTVALWLRYTKEFNDLPVIGNSIGSTYQPGWVVTEDQHKFEWSLCDTANSGVGVADPVGGPIISDGAWHNLVAVFDRGAELGSSYVDGQLVGTLAIGAVTTLITGNTTTIANDPTGTYGVTGSFDLDDLGIWTRPLGPIEARSVYFAGQAGHSFDVVVPTQVTVSIKVVGNNLQISYSSGTLQSSTHVDSGYATVVGASAPLYTTPLPASGSAVFYRVKVQ